MDTLSVIRRVKQLAVATVALASASTANALVIANASASIDWDTLSISVFDVNATDGIAPVLTWANDGVDNAEVSVSWSDTDSQTAIEGDFISTNTALLGANHSISTTYSNATALLSASPLGAAFVGAHSNSASASQPLVAGNFNLTSISSASRLQRFSFSGDAFVLFSVSAAASATASGGFDDLAGNSGSAAAESSVSIFLRNPRGEQGDGIRWSAFTNAIDEDQGGSSARILQVGLFFRAGEIGEFSGGDFTLSTINTTAADATPVPVPAAFWLLGSSLAGILGMSRRSEPRTS